MKKIVFILVVCSLTFFTLSGCSHEDESEKFQQEDSNVEISEETSESEESRETDDSDAEPEIEKEKDREESSKPDLKDPALEAEEKADSRYTGLSIGIETAQRPAYMTIVENLRAARPQSGLSKADIVFETMAEAGITRYIALFQSEKATAIGPIRSTRPYIQEIASSLNLPFAHCGGSTQALSQIRSKGLMSINEMGRGSYFYRAKGRRAPHNLYTSSERMLRAVSNLGYSHGEEFAIGFEDRLSGLEQLEKASRVSVTPSRYTSSSFEYSGGKYYRYQEGRADIDKEYSEHIGVQNVIVQLADVVSLNDKEGHVKVNLDSWGYAYLFRDGSVIKARWSKDGFNLQTKLYDKDGKELRLSPGKTWWYIIDDSSSVKWE